MKKLLLILFLSTVLVQSQSDDSLKLLVDDYYYDNQITKTFTIEAQYALKNEKDEHFTIFAKSIDNGYKWIIRINPECKNPIHCVYKGMDIIYKENEKIISK